MTIKHATKASTFLMRKEFSNKVQLANIRFEEANPNKKRTISDFINEAIEAKLREEKIS